MDAFFKKLLILMAGIAVFFIGTALAADKTLPIGATEYPPFDYVGSNGKVVGADTEVIEQVIKRMGYTVEVRLQPRKAR